MERVIHIGSVSQLGSFDSLSWGKLLSLYKGIVQTIIVSGDGLLLQDIQAIFPSAEVTFDQELSEENFNHFWVSDVNDANTLLQILDGNVFAGPKAITHVIFSGGGMLLGSLEVSPNPQESFVLLGDVPHDLTDQWFQEAPEQPHDIFDQCQDQIEDIAQGQEWIGLE